VPLALGALASTGREESYRSGISLSSIFVLCSSGRSMRAYWEMVLCCAVQFLKCAPALGRKTAASATHERYLCQHSSLLFLSPARPPPPLGYSIVETHRPVRTRSIAAAWPDPTKHHASRSPRARQPYPAPVPHRSHRTVPCRRAVGVGG